MITQLSVWTIFARVLFDKTLFYLVWENEFLYLHGSGFDPHTKPTLFFQLLLQMLWNLRIYLNYKIKTLFRTIFKWSGQNCIGGNFFSSFLIYYRISKSTHFLPWKGLIHDIVKIEFNPIFILLKGLFELFQHYILIFWIQFWYNLLIVFGSVE